MSFYFGRTNIAARNAPFLSLANGRDTVSSRTQVVASKRLLRQTSRRWQGTHERTHDRACSPLARARHAKRPTFESRPLHMGFIFRCH